MLTLINSMTYGVGVSTLAYFLAKTRSTLLSKPSLIISSSNSAPYQHMLPISTDWENPTLRMVISKLRTYTDVKTFCYKVDNFLYYLNVEGIDIKTSEGRVLFNQLLREMRPDSIREGFDSVWIDLDNHSGGFIHYVDDVDVILIPVPPDVVKLKASAERLVKVRQGFVAEFGMQLKTPLFYCVQQYASQLALSKVKSILNATDRYVMPLAYDIELVRQANAGRLSFYISEVLAEPRTTEQKTVHTHLKRLLKEVKPQRR